MSTANSNKKVALQTPERSQKAQTTATTEVQGRQHHNHHHLRQAFASRFGFLSNASQRKPETELLVWKHERVAREKKRSWSWSAPIKISLLFSPLLLFAPLSSSSSSSSLACSSAALLLQATLRPCWEPENGRARTARAGNQRTAVPVPPVQGTREPAGMVGRALPAGPTRETRPDFWSSLTHLLTRESFLFSIFLFFYFLFFSIFKNYKYSRG